MSIIYFVTKGLYFLNMPRTTTYILCSSILVTKVNKGYKLKWESSFNSEISKERLWGIQILLQIIHNKLLRYEEVLWRSRMTSEILLTGNFNAQNEKKKVKKHLRTTIWFRPKKLHQVRYSDVLPLQNVS